MQEFCPKRPGELRNWCPGTWYIISGVSCGISCPWPWGVLKSGKWIQVRRACGADWAEEEPEGKQMLLRRSRGGGMEHPLLWGSDRRLMEMKNCTETGLWGKTWIFLALKSPWKSSTSFFRAQSFVSSHVSYKPSFKPLFSISLPFIYCRHSQAAPSDSLSTNFQGVENRKKTDKEVLHNGQLDHLRIF